MTRSGQAKALGLTSQGKGHLKVGAEADIAIYPIKPDDTDPSTQYNELIAGLSKTAYTIKRGRVVSRDGEVIVSGANSTYWVDPKVKKDEEIQDDVRFLKNFERYYTVRFRNYPVQDVYLPRGKRIVTEVAT